MHVCGHGSNCRIVTAGLPFIVFLIKYTVDCSSMKQECHTVAGSEFFRKLFGTCLEFQGVSAYGLRPQSAMGLGDGQKTFR